MDDLSFIVAGYAVVLGTLVAYLVYVVIRLRSMERRLPPGAGLPPLPWRAAPPVESPDG